MPSSPKMSTSSRRGGSRPASFYRRSNESSNNNQIKRKRAIPALFDEAKTALRKSSALLAVCGEDYWDDSEYSRSIDYLLCFD